MTESFSSFPWHDAVLLDLSVDRRSPGLRDEVRLNLVFPDGKWATFVFHDCYAMVADMNFGVVALETILQASQDDNQDARLIAVRERWSSLGVPLDALHCYRLETNSTASVIRIYAMGFEVS